MPNSICLPGIEERHEEQRACHALQRRGGGRHPGCGQSPVTTCVFIVIKTQSVNTDAGQRSLPGSLYGDEAGSGGGTGPASGRLTTEDTARL